MITKSGSYYLTTSVSLAATGQGGITVACDDVTIDLMGFTLSGPGASSGHGIYQDSSFRNLAVCNGKVVNWGGNGKGGVYAYGACSILSALQVTANYYGISAGNGSVITDCAAYGNEDMGIEAGAGSSLAGCAARGNGANGIQAGSGSLARDCTATGNHGAGIALFAGCTIRGCTARSNAGDGINANTGGAIEGCTAQNNTGDGVQVSSDYQVSGCVGNGNGFGGGDGAGVHASGSDNRIEGNHLRDNDRGLDIDGVNNHVAGNTVCNNTDNYDIAPDNHLSLLLSEIPETLEWPCSARLAGTLTCTETGVNGITVEADDVTIDLAGHALVGPGASSGHGIYQSNAYRNLSVRNGEHGIYAGVGSSLADCAAFDNAGRGIYVNAGSVIGDCTAYLNTGDGIATENTCTISSCAARFNDGDGIQAGSGSTIIGCTARENDGHGFSMASGNCAATDSTATGNEGDGFNAGEGCRISGCVASLNARHGLAFSSNGWVSECMCHQNGTSGGDADYGIYTTGVGSRIEGNAANFNTDYGIVVLGVKNFIARNSAVSNGVHDFSFVVGNARGTSRTTPVGAEPWDNFPLVD